MKNIITIGTQIETLAGFEQVTGYNGSIVYTDSYEVDMDGKAEKVGERKLTTNEIELLMREVDGRNHEVEFIAYRVKDEFADTWFGGEADTDYIEERQTNGIPQSDIDHMVREYGREVMDQLEEI